MLEGLEGVLGDAIGFLDGFKKTQFLFIHFAVRLHGIKDHRQDQQFLLLVQVGCGLFQELGHLEVAHILHGRRLQAFEFTDHQFELADFFFGDVAVHGHHVDDACCHGQMRRDDDSIQILCAVGPQNTFFVLEFNRFKVGFECLRRHPKSIGHLREQCQLGTVDLTVCHDGIADIAQDAQTIFVVELFGCFSQKLTQRHRLDIFHGQIKGVFVAAHHGLQLAALMLFNFAIGGHHVEQCHRQRQHGRQLNGFGQLSFHSATITDAPLWTPMNHRHSSQ